MPRIATTFILFIFLVIASPVFSQKTDLSKVICRKWRVIWFSDDGKEQNMEAKKQQLILKADGTGTMFMLGEKVGDVTWSLAEGKDQINFSDDPSAPSYLVKVSKYKKGRNMLFTGELPNGVERKVYFEILN